MPMALARSRERTTWPSWRDFFSFCCEAFSVLSPVLVSAMGGRLHLLLEQVEYAVGHHHIVLGDETYHLRQHQQAEQRDHRKTQRKQVQRRRHAVQQAEAERSEEHTSELQSHSDLVCRLLL